MPGTINALFHLFLIQTLRNKFMSKITLQMEKQQLKEFKAIAYHYTNYCFLNVKTTIGCKNKTKQGKNKK